ncbi:MAG: MFS transporter [Proteobacteria bacterium]|nr:MFS transporter [Pseudomonadota bacterium]
MRSAIWLLTIVNLLNYLDRYIIASASTKIEAEFNLSHAQTGLIMSAFMIGYMITSPLFGWMADRQDRPRLMGIGVFLWSIATGLTGWVSSFYPLLFSRIAVGVGDRAISIFYTAIPIGAALGYIWGGYMTEHVHWRWAFYLGALPGMFLGFAIWFLKETDRPGVDATRGKVAFMETMRSLWQNREYRLTVLGYTAHTFALGGFASWAPYYCSNILKVSLSEASFKIGAVTCVAGVVGTLIGGKWGDRFMKGKHVQGAAAARGFNLFSAASSLVAAPFAFWLLTTNNINEFMLAMLCVQIGMFSSLSPINTATLAAVPATIAATAFAIQIFVIHALGDVISPPLVGWLADRMPMNQAMFILPVAINISAVIWWIASRNPNGTDRLSSQKK